MRKVDAFTIVCLLCASVSSFGVDEVADEIVTGKVDYCNRTLRTSELTEKDRFYSHIAEQHFGLGVDSYARYSSNPPGGDIKLLRSEFILEGGLFDGERKIVRQGARCLWGREILDAYVKPAYTEINNLIAPIRNILSGIEKADHAKREDIIMKVKTKIAPITVVAGKLNELSAVIAEKLPIIEALLAVDDTFHSKDVDTRVAMKSVCENLRKMLANLAEYARVCRNIGDANDKGTLSLSDLQKLKKIDLSNFSECLQLLENHILYTRDIFTSTICKAAMEIAKIMFEDILSNGRLSRRGPHEGSLINLSYQHKPKNVITMKAEGGPSSSWYGSKRLIDSRPITEQIKLGFRFVEEKTELFYGTMFPEYP